MNPTQVLIGVGGGIAAYKVADLVSRLKQAGMDVHVSMTPDGQEFVTPLTFAALSGHAVQTTMFPPTEEIEGTALFPHLYPAAHARVFLLAPATAGLIARVAHGLASDVVCAAALALLPTCLRFFCPAMNEKMWAQSTVQANVAALERAGWRRIGPQRGRLACGTSGEGRMAEPAEIEAAVLQALQGAEALAGRRVLILSGPTREHLDPVRFIGNPSSGKMGQALAQEALARGAEVDLVTGPVAESCLPRGANLRIHPVISAQDMLAAARPLSKTADVVIFAAAVADYTPEQVADGKLPRRRGTLTLRLVPTPDLAATLARAAKPGQIRIGFALQTGDGATEARRKLREKSLDGIVLNGPEAMEADAAAYRFIATEPTGDRVVDWGKLTKTDCAARIFDEVLRPSARLRRRKT